MRSVPALLLPTIAGVLLLAGCSASAVPVDEAALSAWKAQQDAVVETDDAVLGVLTADIDPEVADEADAQNRDGVRLQFATSQTLDHLEFSCFGHGEIRGVVRIGTERDSTTRTLEPMSCDDSPHRIAAEVRGTVDSVAFNGFDSDRPSSWRLVIVGPGTGAGTG